MNRQDGRFNSRRDFGRQIAERFPAGGRDAEPTASAGGQAGKVTSAPRFHLSSAGPVCPLGK